MESDIIKAYFNQDGVVGDYSQATNRVGLWQSEKIVFRQIFNPEQHILELGCGAGRIAQGLWKLGFRSITAIDFAPRMIEEAQHINEVLGAGVAFQVADAQSLPFEDQSFDGAVFGFNGLMQIPKRANRQAAMRDVFRVLKPGATFCFTTHDRGPFLNSDFWSTEQAAWDEGVQDPAIDEFGDLYYQSSHGRLFIHTPTFEEISEDVDQSGFNLYASFFRWDICKESELVRDFADECRFWIVHKPE